MELFIELGIILAVTTVIAIIMKTIRQPLIVGYIISGVIVGPYVLNVIHATEYIELFSKIGIAILLFIVGISLNPKVIKETGKTSLVTGIGQIVVTSVVGYGILKYLGFATLPSLYGAIALTFSSTIIILKLLSDRGDLETLYGKVSVGFLLVQDIVATVLLVMVPIIGSTQISGGTLSDQILTLGMIGLGLLGGIWIIARFFIPRTVQFLAQSQELLFLFSVTWGIIIAGIFAYVGFSIEIGALVAGVAFSASPYAKEMSARLRPLRDFFIVLFFVLLGAQVVIGSLGSVIVPAIILSGYVLIGNPLIMFFIMNALGYRNRTGFMAGLTVAQISEFSLILVSLGLTLGHIDQSMLTLITMVGIITITGSTYMVRYADQLYAYLRPIIQRIAIRTHHQSEPEYQGDKKDVVIFGYGRIGKEFVRTMQDLSFTYSVVDYNPRITQENHDDHLVFGDAEDIEFFEEINLQETNMVISTIMNRDTNELLIHWYRSRNPQGIVIVTAHTEQDATYLYEQGATYVLLPHYLGAYHGALMIRSYQTNPDIFIRAKIHQDRQIQRTHHHG